MEFYEKRIVRHNVTKDCSIYFRKFADTSHKCNICLNGENVYNVQVCRSSYTDKDVEISVMEGIFCKNCAQSIFNYKIPEILTN